jgi:SAM-dependent methyltransferase
MKKGFRWINFAIIVQISLVSNGYSQHEDEQGAVNQMMHRSSIDRLIRNFESEERETWQKPDEVIGLFGDLHGKTIVDLGAGSGYFTFRLAKTAAKVIAADVDDRFLDHLRERIAAAIDTASAQRIEIRKIPYTDPGLEAEEVDAIITVNTYHHIENRQEYLKNLLNGLKPKGQFMVVDFKLGNDFGPPDDHKLDFGTTLHELSQAGFSHIDIDTTLLSYQYIMLCTK